jgi:DNA-binding NarL/FixJ family response regulator
MKQKFTGVIVFEDNAAFREDITSVFKNEDQFLMLGAFENSAGAAGHVKALAPDVVIMDIEMPQYDGIAGVKTIRAAGLKVPIIMLTAFDDSQHVFEAICAGASAILPRAQHLKKYLQRSMKL